MPGPGPAPRSATGHRPRGSPRPTWRGCGRCGSRPSSNLRQTKVVMIEKTPYTVESVAAFEEDENSTASCKSGEASADYIEIRSTITWPSLGSRAPVVEQSLVAPPNGSVSAKSGSLVVQIENAASGGVKGVDLNGTGAGTFAGVTGESGCAIFGNLPAGNYTLTLSGAALVDKNGEAPKPQPTSVVAESTNTRRPPVRLRRQHRGQIQNHGRRQTGSLERRLDHGLQQRHEPGEGLRHAGHAKSRSDGDAAVPVRLGLLGVRRQLHGRQPRSKRRPKGRSAKRSSPPKGTTPATIVLPPLNLTAWSGTEAAPGEPVKGAHVKVTDTKCVGEGAQPRTYATDAKGTCPTRAFRTAPTTSASPPAANTSPSPV